MNTVCVDYNKFDLGLTMVSDVRLSLKELLVPHHHAIDAQVYRLQQSQQRLKELELQPQNDQIQHKITRLHQEITLLLNNLAMVKSKARTEGLKHLQVHLEQIQQIEGGAYLEALQTFKNVFASLFTLHCEPLDSEIETLNLILDLFWKHLDEILMQQFDDWQLESETIQVNQFRQQKFHPLEKMILVKLHAVLLQMLVFQRKQSLLSEQDQVVSRVLEQIKPQSENELHSPQYEPEQIQQNLNRIQRQFFHFRSRLQNPSLSPAEREQNIQQIKDLQGEQAAQHSFLRQCLIWHCLQKMSLYQSKFSILSQNLQSSLDLYHSMNITQKSQYIKQCLSQDLYKLYLDCQQAKSQEHILKTLDFIQNQQDKVSHLGLETYAQLFQKYLRFDQDLLHEIQNEELVSEQEHLYLQGMLPPLHGTLAQVESLSIV